VSGEVEHVYVGRFKSLTQRCALRLGVVVKPADEYDWRMGSIQLVWRDRGSGKLGGVADPRRLGKAKGF
jgi:gamma-glutamyltranspeptidase